jgi:16S rRNA (guanine527-N7)-methyltransferase
MTPVSRETPPAPDVARGVFSQTLPKAEQFATLLATQGVARGLIGPREAPRLWERHLINCALLGESIERGTDVCDIGSGAGLPGLVLAISRPDLSVTLVEPLLRRADFLHEAVAALGLDNVRVLRARAEELHGKAEFSIVTSRAVAPLNRLLTWSMPLVRQGGSMLAMKGSTVEAEIDAARETLRKLGAGRVRVETYGEGLIDPPTTAVRVEATRVSRLGWEAEKRSSSRIVRTSRRKGRRT